MRRQRARGDIGHTSVSEHETVQTACTVSVAIAVKIVSDVYHSEIVHIAFSTNNTPKKTTKHSSQKSLHI